MICGKCGQQNLEGSRYCTRCGSILEMIVRIDPKTVDAPRKALIRVIGARTKTDEIVSRSWIAAMIVVYLMSFIVAIGIAFSVASDLVEWDASQLSQQRAFEEIRDRVWLTGFFSAVFYMFAGALAYLLVSRLNRHFDGDGKLRTGMMSFVTSVAHTPELKRSVDPELYQMNQIDNLINSTEKRRNPTLWALIVLAPLTVSGIQYYVMYTTEDYQDYQRFSILLGLLNLALVIPLFDLSFYLGKSTYTHHSQWMDFANENTLALRKLGFKEPRSYLAVPMPKRSYGVYTLVTIVTLGLFMFYWWYTLIIDPNRHMKSQWDYEDALVESVT